ncbi:unnamed protein product [Fusarium graminearum]|uniref:Myb-like domain-containing protein n=1 Tax=Gibberella zeae TaxID=5518 RepID=A0A9N8RR57_GIBZA|nr:unnamed protein product [Fusarium graminearum]
MLMAYGWFRLCDTCVKHWTSSLDPDLSREEWTDPEDRILMDAVHLHGRSWKQIAGQYFPNRSTLEIANSASCAAEVESNGSTRDSIHFSTYLSPSDISISASMNWDTDFIPSDIGLGNLDFDSFDPLDHSQSLIYDKSTVGKDSPSSSIETFILASQPHSPID